MNASKWTLPGAISGAREIVEISAEQAIATNGGVTRRSAFEAACMYASRTEDTPNIWTVRYLDGTSREIDARTPTHIQRVLDEIAGTPYTTEELYSMYVSWGFADSDGYYAPLSPVSFANMSREHQLSMAEISPSHRRSGIGQEVAA